MWNKIDTESDILNFMKLIDEFSDSCIKEVKYVSGGYVNEDLSMQAINTKRIVYIYFQRQYSTLSAIEMMFVGVKKLNLEPRNEHKDCVIYDSSLFKYQNLFYWADYEDFDIDNKEDETGTYVISEQLYWRIVNSGLGDKEVYSNLNK